MTGAAFFHDAVPARCIPRPRCVAAPDVKSDTVMEGAPARRVSVPIRG